VTFARIAPGLFHNLKLSYAQEINAPANGKSVVYFMRISATEFGLKFSYFDKDKFIGEFNGPKYMRYECEPGEHLFWVNYGFRDFITAELEAGKIYFIEMKPVMNVMYTEWQLTPVDPKDVKKFNKIQNLISKKPPETFSESELVVETQNLKEEIGEGLVKYEEFVKKGKPQSRLEKQMFYEKTINN